MNKIKAKTFANPTQDEHIEVFVYTDGDVIIEDTEDRALVCINSKVWQQVVAYVSKCNSDNARANSVARDKERDDDVQKGVVG